MVHGLMTKTTHVCERSCSKIFWKDYCCANVKMTHKLKDGKDFNRSDVMCLKRSISDEDVVFKFDKIDFSVACNSSQIIKLFWSSLVFGVSYVNL